MDIGTTLSRAVKITFQQRVLWALMLLPVLLSIISAVVGTAQGLVLRPQDFMDIASAEDMLAAYARLFALWAPLILLQVAISLLSAVILLVVRAGVIAGVQDIETRGTVSFGDALRTGFRKLIPMLAFNIALFLPVIALGILLLVIIVLPFIPFAQGLAGGTVMPEELSAVTSGFVAALCAGAALICVALIYGLIAAGIQVMGERAIVIENAGPIAGLKRGWALFRARLGSIILLAVIIFLITAVIGFALSTLSNLAVLPQMGNWMQQLEEGVMPDVAEMINWPIFIVITLVGAVVGLFMELFVMVIWTLAYRQFTGIAGPASQLPPAPLPAQ